MADQSFNHTAEIMKAAVPYVDSRTKVMVELLAKVIDLMGSFRSIANPTSLAVCGYEKEKINVEGLLTGIRPLCNNWERDFIDRILSIFNAKRMFEMYNNIMSTMKTMQEFGDNPFGAFSGEDDTVNSNFKGFNFDSIFGNNSEAKNNDESASHFSFDTNSDREHDKGPDMGHNSNSSSSNNGNDRMFDMLKAMVPPEQMSTFENLSMLLKTMSYDSNNKPNDSKES